MIVTNALYAEIDRLKAENKKLTIKTSNSLANNLCPDHRDKQAGKPCLACEIDRLKKRVGELEAENQRLWMMNPCNHTGFESAPCDVCGYPDPRKLIAKLEAENISYQNENAAQRREIERIKKVLELGCQDSESVCPYWINMKDFEKENEHLEEESHRLWDEFL